MSNERLASWRSFIDCVEPTLSISPVPSRSIRLMSPLRCGTSVSTSEPLLPVLLWRRQRSTDLAGKVGPAEQPTLAVYVPVRHTDSRPAILAGGRVFPGTYVPARIGVTSSDRTLAWTVADGADGADGPRAAPVSGSTRPHPSAV